MALLCSGKSLRLAPPAQAAASARRLSSAESKGPPLSLCGPCVLCARRLARREALKRLGGSVPRASMRHAFGTVSDHLTPRRLLRLSLVLLFAWAVHPTTSAEAAPPSVHASFDYAPGSPFTNDVVKFTSTSTVTGAGNAIVAQDWDLDDDGNFNDASGSTAARSFSQPGDYKVALRVTDRRDKSNTATATVHVLNRPPSASFSYAPTFPATSQTVTFTSTSSDSDGGIKGQAWDLDNDGSFDDGTNATVSRSFASPGRYTVSLRVTDTKGATSIASRAVAVGDRAPVASFVIFPAVPAAGATTTFVSTSTDPDGPIAAQAWDLDGDGSFDDANGSVATHVFLAGGRFSVSLRVTDPEGQSSVSSRTFTVGASGLISQGGGILRLLSPFPVVRITGTITRKGIRLRRLAVDTPRGSNVLVRCRGRGCPFRRQSRTAATGDEPLAFAARLIRIRRLERRLLRAGVVVRIFITKQGAIGKYTRFRVRKGRPPGRVDRCLVPGRSQPLRCPPT
jgi:PKD repeat protein